MSNETKFFDASKNAYMAFFGGAVGGIHQLIQQELPATVELMVVAVVAFIWVEVARRRLAHIQMAPWLCFPLIALTVGLMLLTTGIFWVLLFVAHYPLLFKRTPNNAQ